MLNIPARICLLEVSDGPGETARKADAHDKIATHEMYIYIYIYIHMYVCIYI